MLQSLNERSIFSLRRSDRGGRRLQGWLGGCLFLLSIFAPTRAEAHHGQDFLLARTAHLPPTGQLYLLTRVDSLDLGEESELEVEPSLLYGFHRRFAGEVHFHLAKEEGEDLKFESTAPALHFRLTDPARPWALGLSVEYEISHQDEHPDRAEAALILSRERQESKIAFNVFVEKEQESGASTEWFYSAGYRHRLSSWLDVGLEVLGNLEEVGDGEALIGLYFSPKSRLTLNVGVGTGYGDQELDLAIRAGLGLRLGN